MRVEFRIPAPVVGFAADAAKPAEELAVVTREALTSLDGVMLPWRLEGLQGSIFDHIPGLPPPSQIDHMLVVIRRDLTATAYVNELQFTAEVRPAGPLEAGQPVYARDILGISSLDLGVEVPPDCGVVLVRSFGWRRALFYDLRPPTGRGEERQYELSSILAQQTLTLIQGSFSDAHAATIPESGKMQKALRELETLLQKRCKEESRYQSFFEENPWILGGTYREIERHRALDDQNVPDFTGVRIKDGFRDVIEIKQPFLQCFKRDGSAFSFQFNDAMNQVERYLEFVRNKREYLRDKGLIFENPRALLIVGHGFDENQQKLLRAKESMNLAVEILTYETVLAKGRAILNLTVTAARAPRW